MRLINKTFIILLIFQSCYCEATDKIINTEGLSLREVERAIAKAKPGDTVTLPAGTAAWEGQLVIRKGISLIGAGIGNTVITSNYTGSGGMARTTQYLLVYLPESPANNDPFRLSGLTIDCAGRSSGVGIFNTSATYPQDSIRVDHTRIVNPSGYAFCQYGPLYGVAHDNDWSASGQVVVSLSLGSQMWTNYTFKYGTPYNFYYEDNQFTGEGVVNSGWGGRYAFRHNTVTITSNTFPVFDAHGNMGPGNDAGLMGMEVYSNTIQGGSYVVRTVDLRGGRCLVYNNELTGSGSYGAQIREEFDDAGNPPIHASDGQPQHIWETYYYGNTRNGSRMGFDSIGTFNYGTRDCGAWESQGCHDGIVPRHNVHFWQQEASFNGSSGVGIGPLSSRPSSCTTEGVGWWATDEKRLYRWKNGRWELYYTPYTYPHPLRSGN